MKSFKILAVMLIAACIFPVQARAQTAPAKPSPETWLQQKGADLVKALSEFETKTRYIKVKQIAKSVLHQREFPRLAFGRYWKELNPQQQDRYRNLFFDYFVVTYASMPLSFEQAKVDIVEKQLSGNDILLKTKIDVSFLMPDVDFQIGNKKSPAASSSAAGNDNDSRVIEVFFALRETPDGYYIRDAQLEGQSMLLFARKQLETEYKSAGYVPDAFLDRMQNLVRKKYLSAEELVERDRQQKQEWKQQMQRVQAGKQAP